MNTEVRIRSAAIEDRKALWEWYVDPLRQTAFKESKKISYQQFCKWYDTVLNQKTPCLWIGMVDNLRMGAVLLREEQPGIVDISVVIKPTYCGKKFTAKLISAVLRQLSQQHTFRKVVTTVHKVNQAAGVPFLECGFKASNETSRTLTLELNT